MDLRITGESLEGALAAQTSRTQETPPIGQSEVQRVPKAVESGRDSVEISDLSARLSAANQQEDARVSGRVSTLAALYARGAYQVDSGNLSHALVSHALSGAIGGDQA
jgi:anti-sigma28 factor (negative regulator of flagellin synthesis)